MNQNTMKKILLLPLLFSSFAFAQKSDVVDFMVIDGQFSKANKPQVEKLLKKKIEFNNRFFSDNNLKVKRKVGKVRTLKPHAQVGYLGMEIMGIVSHLYETESANFGVPLGLATKPTLKKISEWIKREPENYKVITMPVSKDGLDCGMTYADDTFTFTLMHLAEEGRCSEDWILAHELGHQDGLHHEKEHDFEDSSVVSGHVVRGGKCGNGVSLMHSGLSSGRKVLYGHPEFCPNAKGNTPYGFYKAISDNNARYYFDDKPVAKAVHEPVILSEIYRIEGNTVNIMLTLYNPYRKGFTGKVTFVNTKSPVGESNREYGSPKKVSVNGKSVGRYEIKVNRNQLSTYGSQLKIIADINWQ